MALSRTIDFRLKGRFGELGLDCAAQLPAAGVTAIMGRSGSGKTTLLRCLAGLARAEGHVRVGEAVWQDGPQFAPVHRRGVGLVFQEASLLPHLSVAENLAFAARRAPALPGPSAAELAARLGLERLLGRRPAQLSGGERQRTAIARALISRPALLLMDEPLASLDAEARAECLDYLQPLFAELGLPVIHVTHDRAEAERLAGALLVMADGRLSP